MKLAVLQSQLEWENPQANRARFEEKILSLLPTDLIVFPETFTTGFTMNAEAIAESMDGNTVSWMKKMAQKTDAAITGSVIIKEGGSYFNRMLFVKPDGTIHQYDKRHLFSMAKEDEHFTAGTQKTIVEWRGWKILLQICYDLRFPVWSRNSQETPYDLAIYVANWPVPRISAWDKLLAARAIENQCYVAGVNGVGEDGNRIPYNGHSTILNPYGDVVNFLGEGENISEVELNKEKLDAFREKFPVLRNGDRFQVL